MHAVRESFYVATQILRRPCEVAQLRTTYATPIEDALQEPGIRTLRERGAKVSHGACAAGPSAKLGADDLQLGGAPASVERQDFESRERLVRTPEQQQRIHPGEVRLTVEEAARKAGQISIERRQRSRAIVVSA